MSDTSLGFNLIGNDVSASDALQKVAKNARKAGDDFDVVGKNMSGFTGSMTKGLLGVGAALGGAFAIGNVAQSALQFLQDSAAAAIEDEKSMVALSTAMENVGLAGQNAGAEDFVKSLMLATGEADDKLRPALQRLITATGDVDESQRLLALSLDISAAGYGTTEQAAKALSKASLGNVSALTRLGVPLDANIVKSKDFGAAVDALTEKFGGQAAAAADTYGGQLKIVQAAAAEAQETIGYELLNAVQSATEAFGGTGGMVEAITAAGEKAADLVAGIGVVISTLGDLKTAADGVDIGIGDASISLGELGKQAVLSLPGVRMQAEALGALMDGGHEARTSQERLSASIKGSEQLYAGYIRATDDAANAEAAAAMDAEEHADALQQVSDAAKELQGILSSSQSIDDFRKKLADLDGELKGNARTFRGMGDAAKENRDTLRDSLGDASKIAQQWVEDGKISADQYDAAYKGLAKKVVNQFVRDGFKRSDIEAFMGSEGIWTGPITRNLTATEKAALAKAQAVGYGIGRDLGLGTIKGLADQSPAVQASAMRLIAQAEAAARAAAESHSPSQLFYRVGQDLGEGLKLGMSIVWARIAGDINKGMSDLTVTIKGQSDEASGALLQSFANRTDAFKSIIDTQVDKITSARRALDDYSKSVTDTILGNIKFQTTGTDAEGKSVALTPEQIVQMVLGDITNQTNAVNAISQIATKIPEALARQMFTMPPDAAIGLANYLAANPAGIEQLNTNYQELATLTQTTLGDPMAATWATVGDVSAMSMIAKAKERIAEDAADFRRWVRNHLATEITVKVNYDTSGAPVGARAAGGPVTGGLPYLVGERGPELFVPNGSGSIVPNGAITPLGSGGGSVSMPVYVTVQGSVVAEQDLAVTIRDQMAQMMRRRGLNPSVIGV